MMVNLDYNNIFLIFLNLFFSSSLILILWGKIYLMVNLDDGNWRGWFAKLMSCSGPDICSTFQPRIMITLMRMISMMMISKTDLGLLLMMLMLILMLMLMFMLMMMMMTKMMLLMMMIMLMIMIIVTMIKTNNLHSSCSGAKRSPFSSQLSGAGPVQLMMRENAFQ